jgi:dsRNA-specific ribonuclease
MCGLDALPSSLAAAVLEAIIAAIYIDSGSFETARDFIRSSMIPCTNARNRSGRSSRPAA